MTAVAGRPPFSRTTHEELVLLTSGSLLLLAGCLLIAALHPALLAVRIRLNP